MKFRRRLDFWSWIKQEQGFKWNVWVSFLSIDSYVVPFLSPIVIWKDVPVFCAWSYCSELIFRPGRTIALWHTDYYAFNDIIYFIVVNAYGYLLLKWLIKKKTWMLIAIIDLKCKIIYTVRHVIKVLVAIKSSSKWPIQSRR